VGRLGLGLFLKFSSNPSVSAVNFAVAGAVARLARVRVVDAGDEKLEEMDSRPLAATETMALGMEDGAGSRVP
jgi:hypothetical protein